MKKRQLFVFAGQSNMMGACVFPPRRQVEIRDSYEYLHKGVRMGSAEGEFRAAGFPCGEFVYCDLAAAYPEGIAPEARSAMGDYRANTYFVPSMCNLKDEEARTAEPFAAYSEQRFQPGPTLAPYLAQEWEKRGHACAYAHIAKGAVSILHYFDDAMTEKYNRNVREKNLPYPMRSADDMSRGASAYFAQKSADFFRDSQKAFPLEDTTERCLFWLQGEGDVQMAAGEYRMLMEILWERAKQIGFTRFFCVRVGYFGNEGILRVMKAQEDFCTLTPDAYMLTRACSFFPYAGQAEEWFLRQPAEEYQLCRDSFYGFDNQHINEKGFFLTAKRAAENLERVLLREEPPVLEPENVRGLIG